MLRVACESLLERLGAQDVMEAYIAVGPQHRGAQKDPAARAAKFQRRACTRSRLNRLGESEDGESEDETTTTTTDTTPEPPPCAKEVFKQRSAAAKKARDDAAADVEKFKRKDVATGEEYTLGSSEAFDEAQPPCTLPRKPARVGLGWVGGLYIIHTRHSVYYHNHVMFYLGVF